VIGHVIDDKYRVLRRLGAGGMGSVFEAQHTGTGRRVALKVMSDALTENDEMLVRFQREARALGSIETQHIVQVFDLGVEQFSRSPYMAMELLSGSDLDEQIKRHGPLPPEVALRVVAQACLGLQKAHEAGIVHRDIKPANIFLAERDAGELVVKLLDFGIARMRRDDPSTATAGDLTQTGATIGSPYYMSPEQAKGLKTLDHRSDIWSLGVVLYKALCGKVPHYMHTVMGQLIVAICTEPAPPLQEVAPWVTPEVAAIAHKALLLDPNARFSSAQEMLAAIQPLLPGGWSLRKEMFVPLSDELRLRTSPPLQAGAIRHPMASVTAPPLAASTPGTAYPSGDLAAARRGTGTRAAILALAGAVVIVVGMYLFMIREKTTVNAISTAQPESATAPKALPDATLPTTASTSPAGVVGPAAVLSATSSAASTAAAPSLSSRTIQSGGVKSPAPKASGGLAIRKTM
jgi:serine/threonine-protein kinase